MSVFEPNSYLRKVLIFCFHLKKTATEAHRMLSSTYGEAALNERTCCEWFQPFKSGDFDFEDRHGDEKEKIFEDSELDALLVEDSCQMQEEFAESLGVTQEAISKRLKGMGMILGSVRFEAERRRFLVKAEMGGLSPHAVLSRRCSFRLLFVLIDVTQSGSSAFPLLWRSQKVDRFIDRLKRRIVFSRWYLTNTKKMGKSSGILRIKPQILEKTA